MNLDAALASLSKPSWLTAPEKLIRHKGTFTLTKKESKSLLNAAENAIDQGDCLEAENYLYAGLLLDEARFLPALQKEGLLRISRLSYVAEPLTSIVSSLLGADLNLTTTVSEYLRSTANLYEIAKSVREEYEQLRDWLASEREIGIRGVLGTLDYLFMEQSFSHRISDPARSSRDEYFFSVEQLADGLSTLLALYIKEFDPLRGNVVINAELAANGTYFNHLVSGAHLAEFREWEFVVDRFGYKMEKIANSDRSKLVAGSEEQHVAMELGYIRDFQQRSAKSHEWHEPKAMSFIDLGKSIADKLSKFVESPFPRYRFEFPEPLIDKIVQETAFTQEEYKTLAWACSEMAVSVDELFQFDLGAGVTIKDLFLVSRLVNLMHGVSASTLHCEPQDRLEVVFNTLVPSLTKEALTRLVARAVGDAKAAAVVELLLLKSSGYLDVLYTPLIPAGSSVLLPLHIISQADIYRNPLAMTQRRIFSDGRRDPLTDQVAESFRLAGAEVHPHVSYSWNGVHGEIDILALLDGHVFICECKNSLHPTGVHELRTSLDHIETAAEQLSRFLSLCVNKQFRDWLSRDLRGRFDEGTDYVPAIIVSNRMFLGLRIMGYPVRGNYELDHFVRDGVYGVGGETMSMWLGESLTCNDVLRFFKEDITYKPQWEAMESIVSSFEFSECVVDTIRLRMNAIVLADRLGLKRIKNELLEEARAAGIDVDDHGRFVSSDDSMEEHECNSQANIEVQPLMGDDNE